MNMSDTLRKALEELYMADAAAGDNADLYRRAVAETQLTYLPKAQAIEKNAADEQKLIQQQMADLEKSTANSRSQLATMYDQERERLNNQALARGLAHSSIALNMQQDAGQRQADAETALLTQAADQYAALQEKTRSVVEDMQQALLLNDYQAALDARSRYDKLLDNMQQMQWEQTQFEAEQKAAERELAQQQQEFAAKMQAEANKLAQEQAQFEAKLQVETNSQSKAANNTSDKQNSPSVARELYDAINDRLTTVDSKYLSDWYRLLQKNGYYRTLLGDSRAQKLLDKVTAEMERRSRLEAAEDMRAGS